MSDGGARQIGPAKLRSVPKEPVTFAAHGVLVRAFFDRIPKPVVDQETPGSELRARANECMSIVAQMRAGALARGNVADLKEVHVLEHELRLCVSALGTMAGSRGLVTP